MKYLPKFLYTFNLDLSFVRAVYLYETFIDDFADDFNNYSYHQRHFKIVAAL